MPQFLELCKERKGKLNCPNAGSPARLREAIRGIPYGMPLFYFRNFVMIPAISAGVLRGGFFAPEDGGPPESCQLDGEFILVGLVDFVEDILGNELGNMLDLFGHADDQFRQMIVDEIQQMRLFQQKQNVDILLPEFKVGREDGFEAVGMIAFDVVGKFIHEKPGDIFHGIVLGFKMPVKGSSAKLCVVRDHVDGDAGIFFALEQIQQAVDDPEFCAVRLYCFKIHTASPFKNGTKYDKCAIWPGAVDFYPETIIL